MKKLIFVALPFLLALLVFSCKKDESYSQVTDFERNIHNAINKHRTDIGKSELVLQYLMVNDVQNESTRQANGSSTDITAAVESLDKLRVNLGGTASSVWMLTTIYENADSVVNIILRDPEIKATIEGNFNQSAVGAVKDTDGNYHILQYLMLIPGK